MESGQQSKGSLNVDPNVNSIERRDFASPTNQVPNAQIPSFRSSARVAANAKMTQSSTPLGNINAARRPGLLPSQASSPKSGQLPIDLAAKMKAFHAQRQTIPSVIGKDSPETTSPAIETEADSSSKKTGSTSSKSASRAAQTSIGQASQSQTGPILNEGANATRSPSGKPLTATPKTRDQLSTGRSPATGLAAKRGFKLGMKLPNVIEPSKSSSEFTETATSPKSQNINSESQFQKYSRYIDASSGTLNFQGKAVIHGKGIKFSSGSSFDMALDEIKILDELGKGNYGTVYKVRHEVMTPQHKDLRRKGQEAQSMDRPGRDTSCSTKSIESDSGSDRLTGMVMAMKEIRLELDETKLAAIIMELDVLHRCVSPYIIDFYGAFFQEGAVYICMEFMDGGSLDKLYDAGVPESVLRKITYATIVGLKSLKEKHNIIHRDVKPTNILVDTRGQVKICDFGVSGNLVASIAKTNIGCQSYMAPERISGGSISQPGVAAMDGTYSVQSDIWSLGLTIIECALGKYPYPPETYDNIFSQLSAIVNGDPPGLPSDQFSITAQDFVEKTLHKMPMLRPNYAQLLQHPWIKELDAPANLLPKMALSTGDIVDEDVAKWVKGALLQRTLRRSRSAHSKPALHTAPLDAISSTSNSMG